MTYHASSARTQDTGSSLAKPRQHRCGSASSSSTVTDRAERKRLDTVAHDGATRMHAGDATRTAAYPSAMATTATERPLLIDGEWVETGDWVEVRSPYDGSLVGRVAKAGAAETRRAIDAAERAMAEPLPAHKRAEILVRVAGALGRRADEAAQLISRRGRQAAEGGARRGRPRDVDVHDGRRPGANAHRPDGADGRLAGRRGKARLHDARPDRRRRRDLAVQLPAQPRRAQDRPGARRRLRGRAQAGVADAAVGAPARRARGRGRPAAGLAERPRRPLGARSGTCSSRTSA